MSALSHSSSIGAAVTDRTFASLPSSIRSMPLRAASGARVGKMAQLRAEDIIEQDGIPAIRITADAGSVKTLSSERTIPIHPGVIEAGFLDFVRGKTGPLFYDSSRRKADATKPSHRIVAKNVAAWVQGLGLEIDRTHRQDPSHAWRRCLQTLAQAARVNDSAADVVGGHGPTRFSTGQQLGAGPSGTYVFPASRASLIGMAT